MFFLYVFSVFFGFSLPYLSYFALHYHMHAGPPDGLPTSTALSPYLLALIPLPRQPEVIYPSNSPPPHTCTAGRPFACSLLLLPHPSTFAPGATRPPSERARNPYFPTPVLPLFFSSLPLTPVSIFALWHQLLPYPSQNVSGSTHHRSDLSLRMAPRCLGCTPTCRVL